ncbi:MAG: hypothetical protein RL173_3671, partial [Fibrobacterota bacterium]
MSCATGIPSIIIPPIYAEQPGK